MSYKPQVDDYVIWNRDGLVHKGWVYFADENYITIETGIKPKPNCQYTKNEKHKSCLQLMSMNLLSSMPLLPKQK